eukprot:1123972-Pelagomonas_calceolata.AAC.4
MYMWRCEEKRALYAEVWGQLLSIMRPSITRPEQEYTRHHMSVSCTIRWLGEGLRFLCRRPQPGPPPS